MAFLNITAIVCIGLLIGVEFSVSAFVNPVLSRLDRSVRADAVRQFAGLLGRVMPFWYVLSLVFLIVETAVHRGGWGFGWLLGAAAIWTAVSIFSVLVLVPINNRLTKVNAGTFTEAAVAELQRWDLGHRFRVAAITTALVFMLVAVVR